MLYTELYEGVGVQKTHAQNESLSSYRRHNIYVRPIDRVADRLSRTVGAAKSRVRTQCSIIASWSFGRFSTFGGRCCGGHGVAHSALRTVSNGSLGRAGTRVDNISLVNSRDDTTGAEF